MRLGTNLLALVALLLPSHCAAQPASVPLNRAEILGRLALDYSPSYIAILVKNHGVSFSLSSDFLDRVKEAGGDGILVERLSAAATLISNSATHADRPFAALARCADLLHSGALAQSEKDCRAAMDENPESPWPIMAVARIVGSRLTADYENSSKEMAALLHRAITLDPGLVSAHQALLRFSDSHEDFENEIKILGQLRQSPPEEEWDIGTSTRDLTFSGVPGGIPGGWNPSVSPEQRQAFLREIQNSLKQNPDLAGAHVGAAFQYQALGDIEDSLNQFREALRLEPGNPELHCDLGNAYSSQRNTESGLAEYREAVRVAAYDFTFRDTLTRTLLREKRTDDAIREWKDFLGLSPADVKADNALVKIYLDQHDSKSAIAELRRSLKASSDASASEEEFVNARVTDMDRLAHLLTDDRQFEAAMEEYTYLLRFRPDDAVLHNNLGNVHYAQHRCEEASREYREATRLQPDLPHAHNGLANCLLIAQKTDEAIGEYRQTIELDPELVEPKIMLGVALGTKGELNSAIDQFQQILATDPDNVAALASIAHAYYLNKDYASAIRVLKHVLSLKPNFPAAENELAWIYTTAEDQHFRNPGEALALARHAAKTSPQPVPEILDTLAEALLLNGQSAEALKTEEQAAQLAPNNAEIQSRLTHFREAAKPKVLPKL